MVTLTSHASLLLHNTFGLDVKADFLGEYAREGELKELLRRPEVADAITQNIALRKPAVLAIGEGSNLLFAGDYKGVVLHNTAKGIREMGILGNSVLLEVESGTRWDDVCAIVAEHGWYGLENLSYIPGETGAAAVQNIGAYGMEIGERVVSVICYDVVAGEQVTFSHDEMQYSYRYSRLKAPEMWGRYVVLKVVLRVDVRNKPVLGYKELQTRFADATSLTPKQIRQAVIEIRQQKLPDPQVLGNAGSFFKNPVVTAERLGQLLEMCPDMPYHRQADGTMKLSAGWLIESVDWKGKKQGRAAVYDKHALILVNLGGAQPKDLIDLAHAIIDDVQAMYGITLEPEVNILS